jgi:hypothetical protein
MALCILECCPGAEDAKWELYIDATILENSRIIVASFSFGSRDARRNSVSTPIPKLPTGY